MIRMVRVTRPGTSMLANRMNKRTILVCILLPVCLPIFYYATLRFVGPVKVIYSIYDGGNVTSVYSTGTKHEFNGVIPVLVPLLLWFGGFECYVRNGFRQTNTVKL